MINTLYKPKSSRIWRWKFRLRPEDCKIQDVSLGTSDKQIAEKRRAELLREKEFEREGLIPSKAVREAAQRPLEAHLEDFVGDLRRQGRSEKYLANLECRIGGLIRDCGWRVVQDVTADKFQTWRRRQAKLKDKTANDYLEAVRCFFNWLMRLGRAASNPLLSVEKVKTAEGKAEEIRALNEEEMQRLLCVAGDRKPVYLMAVHTGLRHSELGALCWHDLHLDAVTPFVRVRASTTKNGKSAELRLVPEVVESLRVLKGNAGDDSKAVFKRMPRIERFRRDLKKAGIAARDGMGRKAVFHSLRHTFGTNLQKAGVASRVAMALMRHSDRRLTDKVYTDESLLGTWGAFDALPTYTQAPSQIASQKLGAGGHGASLTVTTDAEGKVNGTTVNIGESHPLTLTGTGWHKHGNGGSDGARTRNLCRDRAAL